VARGWAIAEFREKTLSKEGLKARNVELEVEAEAIDKEEKKPEVEDEEVERREDDKKREEGNEEEDLVEGLPVIWMRKRKAIVVVDDDEGEEEQDELDEETAGRKRVRHEEMGLLIFEGLVSLFLFDKFRVY
jgi:hypothetical protein